MLVVSSFFGWKRNSASQEWAKMPAIWGNLDTKNGLSSVSIEQVGTWSLEIYAWKMHCSNDLQLSQDTSPLVSPYVALPQSRRPAALPSFSVKLKCTVPRILPGSGFFASNHWLQLFYSSASEEYFISPPLPFFHQNIALTRSRGADSLLIFQENIWNCKEKMFLLE